MATDTIGLVSQAHRFKARLESAKSAAGPPDFWYPYDSLTNLAHLDRLLTGEHRALLEPTNAPVVADIGAADGDIAFFLASRGAEVDIIDHASTNYNKLEGARKLVEELGADSVRVFDTDLDGNFSLPRRHYDVAIFLGILYHLKNPFAALEALARYAEYCVVSTRIAKFAPDRKTRIDGIPVAYLLGSDECNHDSTNYWIFSKPGLHRLIERTGWSVVNFMTVGDEESDAADMKHDQRAFCLLRRVQHVSNPPIAVSKEGPMTQPVEQAASASADEVSALRSKLRRQDAQIWHLEEAVRRAEEDYAHIQRQIDAIESTKAWRMMQPPRILYRSLRTLATRRLRP